MSPFRPIDASPLWSDFLHLAVDGAGNHSRRQRPNAGLPNFECRFLMLAKAFSRLFFMFRTQLDNDRFWHRLFFRRLLWGFWFFLHIPRGFKVCAILSRAVTAKPEVNNDSQEGLLTPLEGGYTATR